MASRVTHPFVLDQRFGFLVTVANLPAHTLPENPTPLRKWLCKCDCGETRRIEPVLLIQERVRSCGCRRGALITQSKTRHGQSESPEYAIWCGMRKRCINPNASGFYKYGARGTMVCERWQLFENFIADMGPRPSSEHSIDRFPDTNGHYEPGNCRWATPAEQSRNRRNNITLTFNGRTMLLVEWADEIGIKRKTLRARIFYCGWSIERALTAPLDPRQAKRCQSPS